MRNALALFMLLAVMALFTPASAKTYKPPKNSCWSYRPDPGTTDRYLYINTKKMNTTKYRNKTVAYYTVSGSQNFYGKWAPLSGTGFVIDIDEDDPPNQYFRAEMTSQSNYFYSFSVSLILNANIYFGYMQLYRGDEEIYQEYTLHKHDCKDLDGPEYDHPY